MSTCHDAEMLVYTVKVGEAVYTLTPYATSPHHESLWRQPGGAAVTVWNDGRHVHVRTAAKESQYDIIGASAEDATR
jgi:NaMN:DMB phosphoribosyltransferase